MTENELIEGASCLVNDENEPPVTVQSNDYSYEGWLVAVFLKRRSGHARAVVEDSCGRLFIHSPAQLAWRKEPSHA